MRGLEDGIFFLKYDYGNKSGQGVLGVDGSSTSCANEINWRKGVNSVINWRSGG
jgi:hypothetical protein